MVKIKICLVSSAGGHMLQIQFFKKIFDKYEHFFITFKRPDTSELSKKKRVYFVEDPKRNPLSLLKNFFQSFLILLKEKPKVVLTTGAGIAVPTCYLAKLFNSKIIFIEDFCRPVKPSLSGKLIYPIADLFLVQWKKLVDKYGEKAIYGGPVF